MFIVASSWYSTLLLRPIVFWETIDICQLCCRFLVMLPPVVVFRLTGPSRVICRYQLKNGTYLDCLFFSINRLIFQAVRLIGLLEWSAFIQLLFWFIVWWLACTPIFV